ncbi:hemerythrin domain-containing protein [Marinimicrobium sp. ABcell2]|uniref:hemerythrin domain-containing protein n=1 Tax=Marinimicrobium sp. ABcell2 TaxID=3069751 RepID=UPI0027B092A3|nr:hemerythrin domain-containing protein [Marinimicrobium sp. ABcell2]MDQ2078507.1 hemerythrin domain-containing protein [Marinimicrobium sp. ABcell2]
MDTVSQLTADHRKIQRLFGGLERQRPPQDLTALVQNICDQLSIYLTLKEEVFYPMISRVPSYLPQLDESIVEHFSLRAIMETLEGQSAGDPLFTAKVRTMRRHFTRHAEEEERQLFPKVRQLALTDLSRKIQERRMQLVQEDRSRAACG